jgi:uncharacterized integral membrane protein
MATSKPTTTPSAAAKRDRKASARVVAAAVLGGLLVLFSVLNSQTVRIHWIVTTSDVPLIVVILGCGLIGFALGWLIARHRASGQSPG